MPRKPIKLSADEAARDPETKKLLINLKIVFKRYINKRDYYKCIISGESRNISVSHFFGVAGSKNERLAYDPRNAHIMTNKIHREYHETNPLPYIRFMIEKYGQEVVEQMERESKKGHKLTKEEIISLTNDLVKLLQNMGDIKRWNEHNSKRKSK